MWGRGQSHRSGGTRDLRGVPRACHHTPTCSTSPHSRETIKRVKEQRQMGPSAGPRGVPAGHSRRQQGSARSLPAPVGTAAASEVASGPVPRGRPASEQHGQCPEVQCDSKGA